MTDSGNMPPPPPGDNQPPSGNGGSNSPIGGAGGESVSFLSALFDFSFTHFITPKIVRVLYILLTIAIGIGFLGFVISAFSASTGFGVLALLVIGPIGAVIYLAFIRVTLEFYLAVVRMSEDIHKSNKI